MDNTFATFELNEFTSSGSGFSVNQVPYLESEMVKLLPLTGSCASGPHEVVSRRKAGCRRRLREEPPEREDPQ